MHLDLAYLREKNLVRCAEGFNHPLNAWSVAEWGNATAGECGEACNVAKKMLRFRNDLRGNEVKHAGMTREDFKVMLAHEVAGMIIYADLWLASEGIDTAEAIVAEFNGKSDELHSPTKL